MKRRLFFSFLVLVAVSLPVFCYGKASGSNDQATTDPLLFPKDEYTVETKTVSTSAGTKAVTYHLHKHIAYVANPVDTNYQSMNVSVPVTIDGVAIDATNAPILFDIAVGGYLSSSNADSGASTSGDTSGGVPSGGTPPGNGSSVGNADLALAAGYVVVSPGCRGRDNVSSDGTYYGKAPAAIVDLKSAVRYIRHNKGVIPGNTDWIVSTGSSAGGALSALPETAVYMRNISRNSVQPKLAIKSMPAPAIVRSRIWNTPTWRMKGNSGPRRSVPVRWTRLFPRN